MGNEIITQIRLIEEGLFATRDHFIHIFPSKNIAICSIGLAQVPCLSQFQDTSHVVPE